MDIDVSGECGTGAAQSQASGTIFEDIAATFHAATVGSGYFLVHLQGRAGLEDDRRPESRMVADDGALENGCSRNRACDQRVGSKCQGARTEFLKGSGSGKFTVERCARGVSGDQPSSSKIDEP